MNYLHYEFDADADDVIEVILDHAANVQLLDPTNYGHYQNGRPFHYRGGYVTQSPHFVRIPHAGHWHVVVDLGGKPGTVRASARLVRAAERAAL